jgi:hypothetical protein
VEGSRTRYDLFSGEVGRQLAKRGETRETWSDVLDFLPPPFGGFFLFLVFF